MNLKTSAKVIFISQINNSFFYINLRNSETHNLRIFREEIIMS